MRDPVALAERFGGDRVRANVPLAPRSTFRVGGPAQWYLETASAEETAVAIRLARADGVPVTVLGGGSNVLIADAGVPGLVVRPCGHVIDVPEAGLVRAEAGATINGLVRWTISRGLAGLERWAGTPGTVGGAVSGNAHYDGRPIGELVARVSVVDTRGTIRELEPAQMEFGYDRSRLQRTGEVLLRASFRVEAGVPEVLRGRARASLAHRKRTQPLARPSAGCVFRNPETLDGWPTGIPLSAGALLDAAGQKGRRRGGAVVSSVHANFIVNEGGASARDIRALIEACREAVHDRFGVDLQDEIVCLGEFQRQE